MNKAVDLQPKNYQVSDTKPNNFQVANIQPKNQNMGIPTNFVYLETKTINVGQPIPWGLNWLITYPTTLVFQAVRG